MGVFDKRKRGGGISDVIRCDEKQYLVWKWHPEGSEEGETRRENAIRWGSQLRVKEGEVAVFVYRQKNGVFQDFIEGPFDQTIKTGNLPILSGIIGLAFKGDTPFQAEIYFINLAGINQVKFGVPYFDVFDYRFSDFSVPVAVRGTISFKIENYREFIKLHRLISFSHEDFQNQIKDSVKRCVKNAVTGISAKHSIPVVQIESRISIINEEVEQGIKQRLLTDFGVTVTGVDVGAVEVDKDSDGYIQLARITQEVTATKIKAQTDDFTERLRIQREEEQYALHKRSQSANLDAFKVEKGAEVGIAGANALGEMGKNGAGDVSLGGGGFNPMGMMAGMTLGGAVGRGLSETLNSAIAGGGEKSVIPPPIPNQGYHLAVNGSPTGPYSVDTLRQMVLTGAFTRESLVWKVGMPEWKRADLIDELVVLFAAIPPAIPQ